MQKIKILALGCNSFLGFNFTKEVLKNNSFVFRGTLNNSSSRIKSDQTTRECGNFIKFNSILNTKKFVILNK